MRGDEDLMPSAKQPAAEAALVTIPAGEAGGGPSSAELGIAGSEEATSAELLEQVLSRGNLLRALKRVVSNDGAPGVDGRRVDELAGLLKTDWVRIREALRSGSYQPMPVRQVTIPKANGGERRLGIPTVLDRFIQQALLQVLQAQWDASFSDASYGFRPGRSAHQAVERARSYVAQGRAIVVDVDLEAFFDRVNHDVLMGRVAKRVTDKRVLKLIRAYLNAGILRDGLVSPRDEGTPQGGPLSPLLSNLLLDEIDRELEKRGHRFVRYADDLNVYVRSQRAGERVMEHLTRLLGKLRLRVNLAKSAVAPSAERQFLGFRLVPEGNSARVLIAPKAANRFRERVRELTPRRDHRTMLEVIQALSRYLRGWAGYFGLAQERWFWGDLFGWLSRRLRMRLLCQWKTAQRAYAEARRLGGSDPIARSVAHHRQRFWRTARQGMNRILPTQLLLAWGLYDLRQHQYMH